jgi:hypothetical protein
VLGPTGCWLGVEEADTMKCERLLVQEPTAVAPSRTVSLLSYRPSLVGARRAIPSLSLLETPGCTRASPPHGGSGAAPESPARSHRTMERLVTGPLAERNDLRLETLE